MDVRVLDLRYFVAVAEELSFTKAASERLFVSQPALSKQIRQLETTLRTRLFDRDRRTVSLTPAGEALLPRAQSIVEQWDAARRAVADVAGLAKTTLTVGFQTRIGRGLIPAVTTRMAELLPDWRLQFRQVPWSDATAGLAGDEVDVAIAWLPVPEHFARRVVSTEEMWVALPPKHRLTRLDVVPFEELVDEPFVALPKAAGALREFWLASAHRPRPALIAAEAETGDETFEAVASGLGVVLMAEGNVDASPQGVVAYRRVAGLPPSELAVVWRANDHRHAMRVFLDSCVRCLCV